MSQPALAQLRRILALIPELADDRGHSLQAVARRAGTDRPTLLRDLMLLAERFDDPGGFVEGVQVFIEADEVTIHSSHFLRPMRLTPPELCALELGLGMLRGERPPEEHRAIDRARARLRDVITRLPGPAVAEELRCAASAPVDAVRLGTLRRAVQAERKLRLTYRSGGATRSTRRTTRPYGLVFAGGMWYLVAHCERGEGLRFFRVDRIEAAEPLEARFVRPAGFALEEVLQGGRAFRAEAPRTLIVWYSASVARWLAERSGKPLAADGSLTLEHPLADTDWAVRHVLQYGPEAEVLAPADVREAVRERLLTLMAG